MTVRPDIDWPDAQSTLDAIAAKSGRENFPVASRLIPARYRRHLLALYGFARLVDDIGDVFDPSTAADTAQRRLDLLDAVDADVERLSGAGHPRLLVLRQLAPTVRECRLDLEPFHCLVEANRRDQRTQDYQTWTDLLDYCTYSADPVGRLVLGVFGAADPGRTARSDSICTALQLLEHWQDVAEDARSGRIYLPAEDRDRFGVRSADLTAAHAGPALRRLLAYEVSRTQALLTGGRSLVGRLAGPARIAVAGYVAGGQAGLDALAAADFDVLPGPPRAGRVAIATRALRLVWGGGR